MTFGVALGFYEVIRLRWLAQHPDLGSEGLYLEVQTQECRVVADEL